MSVETKNSTTASLPVLQKRSPLMDSRGAAWWKCANRRQIASAVDEGTARLRGFEFVWDFNTNPNGKKRILRFLAKEVIEPQKCNGLKLPDVLKIILGEVRQRFHSGAVVHILNIDHKTLYDLKKNNQLPAGTQTPRAALEKFLIARRIGGMR